MNFHVESYYDNTIPTIQDTYSNRALIVPYNCSPLYLLSSLQVLGLQLSVFRDSETDQLWIIIKQRSYHHRDGLPRDKTSGLHYFCPL